ncbi:MAG TPA: type II toxin-antitoxin system VapC family toxin [Bryobacteraceae bacterium]|jgi:predicted nucleic acid-binding protein|nr:type II toxin-antitoxin system VapC family toxin [Bryobacteraceae bacterium]
MIVVDASAILEILKQTPTGIEMAPSLAKAQLHAPHLIDLEIVNALRRWEMLREMSHSDVQQALEAFLETRIVRHNHTHLLQQIWSLRNNLTAYDAAYLALARTLDAELLTMDAGLRRLAARR